MMTKLKTSHALKINRNSKICVSAFREDCSKAVQNIQRLKNENTLGFVFEVTHIVMRNTGGRKFMFNLDGNEVDFFIGSQLVCRMNQ